MCRAGHVVGLAQRWSFLVAAAGETLKIVWFESESEVVSKSTISL